MKRNLQKMMAAIAFLSIMSLLLAACGGTDATATTAPAAATDTPAAAGGAATDTPMAAAATDTPMAAAATDTPMAAAATDTPMAAVGTDTPMAAVGTDTPASGGTGAATETPSSGGTGGNGTAAAVATMPANCSNVDLSFWTGLTGPDGPVMQQIIDGFNSANSNIKVTMTIQQDYVTALGTAKASGGLPDLTQINEDQAATQAFLGVIRPMDDIVKLTGLSASDFPATAWKAGTIAGKQYTLPLSFVAMTMYYNNDLLKAAGMTAPPATKDDFEKAAAAMTSNGNNGFLITSGFPVQQIFQQLLHQFGGTELNADGTAAAWNSDAGVQALNWMLQAQSKYSQPKLEVDADLNGFKAGTAGMIWNGSWQLPNVTGSGVSFAGMAAAPPQIGSQPATWAGGFLMGVTTARKAGADPCKDAAAAIFYRYLEDHGADWAKAGNIPAYNPARNSDAFLKDNPLAPLAKAVENPVFPPVVPGVSAALDQLGAGVSAVMLGNQTDVKAALDDAANKANAILQQNATKYGATPPNQ